MERDLGVLPQVGRCFHISPQLNLTGDRNTLLAADDVRLRGTYPGDTRAALVPFLAHEVLGDYRWMLYGDDDTAVRPVSSKVLMALSVYSIISSLLLCSGLSRAPFGWPAAWTTTCPTL